MDQEVKSIISLVSPLDLSSFCTVGRVSTDCHYVGVCIIPTSAQTLPLFQFIPPFSVSSNPRLQELQHRFCFDMHLLYFCSYMIPCMYLAVFCPGMLLMWAVIHLKTLHSCALT